MCRCAGSLMERGSYWHSFSSRHGRACPGHPRLTSRQSKTWMPGTRPGMTAGLVGGSLAQLVALDFSGGGFWQRLHHVDPARIFPRADFLLHMLLQHFIEAVRVAAVAQHHKRLWLEQPFRIGF